MEQAFNKYSSQTQFEDTNEVSSLENDEDCNIYKRSKKKINDLQSYLGIRVEDINDSVFLYWKINARRWPRLSLMARDFLTIPATSTDSERSFSVGRDKLGLTRHSMKPYTMQATMCLRYWYRSGLNLN